MFLIFFMGEGIINNIKTLKTEEIILLSLIPGLFTLGTALAWKKELLGGIIICSSVIAFNVIDYIIFRNKTFSFNFLILLIVLFIIGMLFIIVGINNRKTKKKIN